jgi:uncharacterized protein (DUF2384 family)
VNTGSVQGSSKFYKESNFVITQNSNKTVHATETVDSLPFQVILLPTWKKCTYVCFSKKSHQRRRFTAGLLSPGRALTLGVLQS